MPLMEDPSFEYKTHTLSSSELVQLEPIKGSKVRGFLKELYSYPPKFAIRWGALDELNEDLFFRHNYGVLEHSLPFIDFIEDWFFNDFSIQESIAKKYSVADYLNGYLDKVNTTNFYKYKTKSIQSALSTIPTFVVLNGHNEIIVNKPTSATSSNDVVTYINKFIYNYCGAFDTIFEPRQKIGLFFLNVEDAKIYLQEVAKLDPDGTKTLGLSINCIGLDTAYKIAREDHPEIDFRFVPDFQEIKNLLNEDIVKSDMIVEDEQQQLRFRRRTVNQFPYLEKLGKLISPANCFLLANEYFKGVPIYLVQVSNEPRNLIQESYFVTIGVLDHVYSKIIDSIDHSIGFGQNWIMQGSLRETSNNENLTNYVFLNKKEALKFVRRQGRTVKRYTGSRTSNVSFLVKKPKIYVYNLEDYIEFWEETINQNLANENLSVKDTIFNAKNTYFVPSQKNVVENTYKVTPETISKSITNTMIVKWRVLKQFVGLIFSMG